MADRRAEFAAFYAANAEPVRRALGLLLRDAHLAEEATQEAFTRAYMSWRRVGTMDRPATWVYVVALHVAYRRRGRDAGAPAPAETRVIDVADTVATREAVRVALAQLPERQRTAVVLRYLIDLPLSDIATAMGCAVGTVKSTLHAALQRLGVELEDDSEEIHDARPDELRHELSELAGEPAVAIEDVQSVMRRGHRRIARRYSGIGVAVLIVGIGLVGLTVRGRSPNEPNISVRPNAPTTPTTLTPTVPLPPVRPVASSGPGDIIFTAADVGWICGNPILHTADGGRTWQESRFGQSLVTQGTACASVPGDDLWAVVGTTHPSVLQVQGGSDLSSGPIPPPPEGSVIQITFADAQHGWVLARATANIGTSGVLYRSTDGGIRYALVSQSAPATGVAFSSATEGWGISVGADLWHTTDAGSNWADVRVPFPTPAPDQGIVFETISVAGPVVVAEGRRNEGHASDTEFFDVSRDDGHTWTLHYGPPGYLLGSSPPVAVVDGAHWRLAGPGQLWVTDDAGATWTQRTAPAGVTIAIAFPTPNEGWALTSRGVFETTDGARSWHAVDTTAQPDWHTGLAFVPGACPSQPVTPAPATPDPRTAAVQAAREFVLRTRGWTTERLEQAYRVGQGRGDFSSIFAANVPKDCGHAVAAASYGVELINNSITENNSLYTALVVAHFADGWRVWGYYH